MYDVDAVVVGAGVVGLAIARRLSATGLETIVLERNEQFGAENSARNSEVIHAGIYYPPGSLKARLCRAGRDALYTYCEARGIPHRRIGKLIYATSAEQRPRLDALLANAAANQVEALALLSGEEAGRLEPALKCDSAILSPSTGIVDSHAFMTSLIADLEDGGGKLVCHTRFARAEPSGDGGWSLWIDGEDAPVLRARYLVNSAGLAAHEVAAAIAGYPQATVPPLHLARGVYYSYAGRLPFDHLIYPLPGDGGLGIHLTMDLAGGVRFGPNVEWVDDPSFAIPGDARRDEAFRAAAQSICAGLDASKLSLAFAGMRPKLSGPGEPAADFLIAGPADHGLDGLVCLFGIESPGLTSSLAIADQVASRLSLADSGGMVCP